MTNAWTEVYDALAPAYDQQTGRDGWWPNEAAAGLLAPLGLSASRVLDLGAGTGQTSEMLLGLYPGAAFTLVDLSARMVDVARAKLPGATVVESDASDFLRSTTDEWDMIAAIGCLELVPDLFQVLRLATSRLAPGGHLVVTHEPLQGASVQAQPCSRLSGGRLVHRYAREDLERRAVSYGLMRVADRDLTAFQRGDSGEDVIYKLVVWAAG